MNLKKIKDIPKSILIMGGGAGLLVLYLFATNQFSEQMKWVFAGIGLLILIMFLSDQKPRMISPDEAKKIAFEDAKKEQRKGMLKNGYITILGHKAQKMDEKYYAYFIPLGVGGKPAIMKIVDCWTGIIIASFPINENFGWDQIRDIMTFKDLGSKLMKLYVGDLE